MARYPLKTTVIGTTRIPSALLIQSRKTACGALTLGRKGGPSPEGPSAANPPESFLYVTGTSSLIPRIGGATEFISNQTGGAAVGAAVARTPFTPNRFPGVTVMGSDNVIEGNVKVCGPSAGALPAFGIMANGAITYFYVAEADRSFCWGDETAWLAQDTTNFLAVAPAASGSLGNRRDGRTTFGNDDESESLVIESGGKSGAVILASGDQTGAVALYLDATGTPAFDTAPNWFAYARS
ncbi:MAG: hypothetical protein C5B60_03895 [Chloroflexi bacterium]|nr:MAG: hypothetical protein C5B60_03895 [Chloroflexota bacterium]